MKGQRSRRRVWATPVPGVIFLALLACGDPPVAPSIAAAARASTSGDPTVSAVAPDSATRDTTLDVTVTGQNFDNGSRVDMALAGVVSDSVRTNRTTFVNSRKLVANITIAKGADTGKYDVIVTATTGKKGIGTELFTINSNATQVQFVSSITLFSGAPAPDYVAALQSVKGSNTANRISVTGSNSPYAVTVAYSASDVAACDDGGARLSQALGTFAGSLGITVDKTQFVNGESAKGVVVGFTVIGNDGASYSLSAGGGANRLDESDPTLTRIAKTGGFIRVKRNGERAGALCNGIVDFEFTVSR